MLAAFHYGNLTHPSQDPPRIGLLSTVPTDGGERLREAVMAAEQNHGNLPGAWRVAFTCLLAAVTDPLCSDVPRRAVWHLRRVDDRHRRRPAGDGDSAQRQRLWLVVVERGAVGPSLSISCHRRGDFPVGTSDSLAVFLKDE